MTNHFVIFVLELGIYIYIEFVFKSYGNQIFVRQIVNNHTFVFYLVLFTQCIIRSFFLSETFLYIFSDHEIIIESNFFFK